MNNKIIWITSFVIIPLIYTTLLNQWLLFFVEENSRPYLSMFLTGGASFMTLYNIEKSNRK